MSKLKYVIYDLEKNDYEIREVELGERFNFEGFKTVVQVRFDSMDTNFAVLHEDDPTLYPIKSFRAYGEALSFALKAAVISKFEVLVF